MRLFTLLAIALATLPAQAAFITEDTPGGPLQIDVGATDLFIADGDKVGSPASEEIWVNTVLGTTTDWTISAADVAYQETSLNGVFAFELFDEPDWFIVKNSRYIGLFENVASLEWGVFNVAHFTEDFNLGNDGDLWEISHVTEFVPGGGTTRTNVPEPGPLALLALGLVAFGVTRLRT